MKLVFRLVRAAGLVSWLVWPRETGVRTGHAGRLEVKAGGTIAIPISVLRQIGAEPGAAVQVYSDGEGLVIERVEQAKTAQNDATGEASSAKSPPAEG